MTGTKLDSILGIIPPKGTFIDNLLMAMDYKNIGEKYSHKQQIKSLFLDLTNEEYQAAFNRGEDDPVYVALVGIRSKLEAL